MLSRWRMQEQHSGEKGLPQMQYAFLELPKYEAGDAPGTLIEKWAYFFREAKNLNVVPDALSEGPFRDALEVSRTAGFSADEGEACHYCPRAGGVRAGHAKNRPKEPAAVTTPGAISTRRPGVLTAAGSCCAPPTPIWDSRAMSAPGWQSRTRAARSRSSGRRARPKVAWKGRLEGRQEGRSEGIAEGKRETLLRLLVRRGIALAEEDQARVAACTDTATLDRWFDRALEATTAAEVFA